MTNKNLTIGLLITLVIAITALFTPAGQKAVQRFGSTSCQTSTCLQGGFTLISALSTTSGTFTLGASETCTLVSDTSIAATSTGTATCSTPGTVAGDNVFVQLATTTTKLAAQWQIIGTVAGTDSTTVRLLNLTGQAAVPSATNGFGSSSPYFVTRP